MSASALLVHLTDLGVRLSVFDGTLAVEAPRGVLTEADREAMRAHKAELLALVAECEPPDWPASVVAEFNDACVAHERVGHPPGEAARLAYEHLKRRYDGTSLRGSRRTAFGTLVWSDPDAPAIELFGPAIGPCDFDREGGA